MTTKKIFVHIGMSKTGTSSIQKFLFENSALLNENGFYYPSTGMYSDKSHNELSFAIKPSPIKSYSLEEKIVLIDELFNEVSSIEKNNIILSSDRFSCLLDDDYFSKKFVKFEFYVVAYIRNPEDYIESWYKQWLKVTEMNMNLSFTSFFNKYFKSFSMAKRLKPWQKYINNENICISSFEQVKNNTGIIYDFLSIMGINPSDITKQINTMNNENVSFGYMSSKIMRVVNEFGDFPDRNKFLLLCKSLEDKTEYKGRRLISPEQIEIISKYYLTENENLLINYNRVQFMNSLKDNE